MGLRQSTDLISAKQVRIHEISRESSNLCPPRRSDTPSSASSSILRIFGRPKKTRDGRTHGRTHGRTPSYRVITHD